MDINQLSEIVKKKILDNKLIDYVELEDKSFLHKNHKTNNRNKFHIKLKIKSEKLKNMNPIDSNKFIYKLLDKEIKSYIHSLQILFFWFQIALAYFFSFPGSRHILGKYVFMGLTIRMRMSIRFIPVSQRNPVLDHRTV